jgi:hypothetical protein
MPKEVVTVRTDIGANSYLKKQRRIARFKAMEALVGEMLLKEF